MSNYNKIVHIFNLYLTLVDSELLVYIMKQCIVVHVSKGHWACKNTDMIIYLAGSVRHVILISGFMFSCQVFFPCIFQFPTSMWHKLFFSWNHIHDKESFGRLEMSPVLALGRLLSFKLTSIEIYRSVHIWNIKDLLGRTQRLRLLQLLQCSSKPYFPPFFKWTRSWEKAVSFAHLAPFPWLL